MKERSRNMLVGLTVLVGLAMLAALIVAFAGLPEWFSPGYRVEITFPKTYDIVAGDPIYLLGKRVGIVRSVAFTNGDPRQGVTIIATVDADFDLPSNVRAQVFTQGLTGKGYLSLNPTGPLQKDAAGRIVEFYSRGERIVLKGEQYEGGGLLPPKLVEAFEDFGKLARSLNELIEPADAAPPSPTTGPAATQPAAPPPPGLKGVVARLNRTLDSIYELTGDSENRENLRASLAGLAELTGEENRKNLQTTLANLAKASASADELMRTFQKTADEVSDLVTQLEAAVAKINKGKGTLAQLLNDPALYDGLVKAVDQIELLARDLRALSASWQKEGVPLKLK